MVGDMVGEMAGGEGGGRRRWVIDGDGGEGGRERQKVELTPCADQPPSDRPGLVVGGSRGDDSLFAHLKTQEQM